MDQIKEYFWVLLRYVVKKVVARVAKQILLIENNYIRDKSMDDAFMIIDMVS